VAKLAGWSVIGASITWRVRVVGSPARAPTAARRRNVALAGIVGMRGIAAQIVRVALVGGRRLRGIVSSSASIILVSSAVVRVVALVPGTLVCSDARRTVRDAVGDA
jgi:hypothetical protein